MKRIFLLSSLAIIGGALLIALLLFSDASLYLRSQVGTIIPTTISRQLSWTPPSDTAPGTKTVTVVATDDKGGQTSKTITINVEPGVNPTIHSVVVTPHANDAEISWQMSDAAPAKVDLSLTADLNQREEKTIGEVRQGHTTTLDNLISCSRYHFHISAQINNQPVNDRNRSFTTKGCPGEAAVQETAAASIDPAQGGSVALNTLATVTAPTGFGPRSAVFQINQLDRTQALDGIGAPTGLDPLSGLFNLTALTTTSSSLSTFSEDLQVTLAYTPAQNTLADTVSMHRWDGSSWQALTNCTKTDSSLTCPTSAFSAFGVFGQGGSSEPPAAPASVNEGSNDGGDNGGGGGGGGGDGGGEEPAEAAPARNFTYQVEKDHKITGSYSGIEKSGKTVVLAHSSARLERKVTVPGGNYFLDVQAKHDKPGPVRMVIYLNNRAWKVIKLDKNDNKYRTHRVGVLRNFKGGTIRFRLLDDVYDRNDPANADKDRNLHVDWWRLTTN